MSSELPHLCGIWGDPVSSPRLSQGRRAGLNRVSAWPLRSALDQLADPKYLADPKAQASLPTDSFLE